MTARARLMRWMAIVGVSGLFAGAALGFVLAGIVQASAADAPAVVRRFEAEFGLDKRQVHQIRRVLVVRDREILGVYREHSDRIPGDLTDRIETIKRKADERIQAVLDSTQREQYRKARAKDSSGRSRE